MNYTKSQWREHFQKYYSEFRKLGLAIDLSRMNVGDAFFEAMKPRIQKAFGDIDALGKGTITNPDEKRMMRHDWLFITGGWLADSVTRRKTVKDYPPAQPMLA